jgi:serine/threonine protein kinase
MISIQNKANGPLTATPLHEGMHSYMVLGSKFEIDTRYEIIDPVGSGAYGIVVAAKDLEAEDSSNNLVAIKKIEKAFEHKVFA